jgi:hypothetical protein
MTNIGMYHQAQSLFIVGIISQRQEAISKVSTIPPIPEYELIELVRNK